MPAVFSFEQADDGPTVPAAIQALAVMLTIGGLLTVVISIVGLAGGEPLRHGGEFLIGLLYLVLARAVQQARRWARPTLLVLCAIGFALGVYRLATGGFDQGGGGVIWSTVYAVLLATRSARAWFRR
jgi:hypothetical protein